MHILLFDIDGTLLNTGGAGQRAMLRALEAVFEVPGPTEDIPAAGRTDRAIIADLFRHHNIDDTPAARAAFRRAYVAHLEAALPELSGRVLPGIADVLSALAARDDVHLGLLTGNFEQGARLKLAHYGLEHHFGFGGFGDDHLHRDDVARAARAAAEVHVNGRPAAARLWVVGDTPADIQCGRAIGARVVAVATGIFSIEHLQDAKPDHLFGDLSDPRSLLSLLAEEEEPARELL